MKEIILLGALAVLYKIGGRLFDRLDHFFEGLMPPRESSYEPEERNLEDGWKIRRLLAERFHVTLKRHGFGKDSWP